MSDLVLVGAEVYDGTGAAPYRADVQVRAGRIAAVAGPGRLSARRRRDADGLALCPGFIDPHSHSEWALLGPELPAPKVLQGVTTEVLGQDGISVAPIPAAAGRDWEGALAGLLGRAPQPSTWPEVVDYFAALDAARLPVNAAYLLPHGALRMAGPGLEERPATPDELPRMVEAAQVGLNAGAVGVSTGLIYPPCNYAARDELVALATAAGAAQAPVVVHLRNEGRGLLESVTEMLEVTAAGRARLHISHLKTMGRGYGGVLAATLARLEQARAGGHGVTADQYPYTAGSTVLSAVLPGWAHAGGAARLLARLRDPGERGRIAHYFTLGPEVWENRALTVGWENIWVSQVQSAANKWVEGMSVAEAAARRGQDPVDTVLDLLVEEELAVTMITFYGAEAEASEIAARPWVMPCSDGIYGGKPHPRLWGAFPRFFRRFVRKERRVEMAEAVRRATSLPARTFGLVGRGVIAVGAWADLVLFDPELLGDRATYAEPELPPAGIEAVLVNGELVVESGRLTGAAPGRVVRRREP